MWPVLASLQLILLFALGAGSALWLQPEPHSDWLYYWTAAGNADAYVRGGLSLWLLSIPKLMGLSPVASALALNLPAAAWLWFLAYRIDRSRWKLLAHLVFLYLLLITPYFGIVQLDLVAAAQLGTAFWLMFDQRLQTKYAWKQGIAAVSIAFAVSTKPQYALTLWTMLAMMCLLLAFFQQHWRMALSVIGTLLVGSILGFATDMAMRVASGKTEQIRTSSAVTLYGGLLVSSDRRSQGCGYWSMAAAEAAKADLHKSLPAAVFERLEAKPMRHWVSVLRCKVPEIVRPPPFALYWLVESPNIRSRTDASAHKSRIDARYHQMLGWERSAYGWSRNLILLACVWIAFTLRRKAAILAVLPVLWIVSFWCVHAVFEIQGRYFLGMFVVAPILCAALVSRFGRDEPTPLPQT
jgi:hypothetical protein